MASTELHWLDQLGANLRVQGHISSTGELDEWLLNWCQITLKEQGITEDEFCLLLSQCEPKNWWWYLRQHLTDEHLYLLALQIESLITNQIKTNPEEIRQNIEACYQAEICNLWRKTLKVGDTVAWRQYCRQIVRIQGQKVLLNGIKKPVPLAEIQRIKDQLTMAATTANK